jgi:hypothetical protein
MLQNFVFEMLGERTLSPGKVLPNWELSLISRKRSTDQGVRSTLRLLCVESDRSVADLLSGVVFKILPKQEYYHSTSFIPHSPRQPT